MLLLALSRLFLCMRGYACRMYEPLYHSLCCIKTCETVLTTELLNIKMDDKNGQHTKRSSSQTCKRPTRPHSAPVPKHTTNARLPNNHKNTQKLRRLLRTKHHIPTTIHTRKERLRKQPMEHEQRKTQKSLQTNKRRTNNAELHRKLTEPAVPENRNKQCITDES